MVPIMLEIQVEQKNVNCCEIHSKFDEKVVEEENVKLMLSSMEKKLKDIKDKLKNVCNENRKSEAELKSVTLKLQEFKTKTRGTNM